MYTEATKVHGNITHEACCVAPIFSVHYTRFQAISYSKPNVCNYVCIVYTSDLGYLVY